MHELFCRSDGLLSRAMLPLHFMCLHGTDQMSRRETQRSNKNEASKRQEAVSHHVPSSFLKLSSCARLADGRNIEWFKPGAAQSNRLGVLASFSAKWQGFTSTTWQEFNPLGPNPRSTSPLSTEISNRGAIRPSTQTKSGPLVSASHTIHYCAQSKPVGSGRTERGAFISIAIAAHRVIGKE